MEQENKERATTEGKVDELTQNIGNSDPAAGPDEETELCAAEIASSTVNPGRMIMAGVITASLIAVIAVLVAGVFQLTARWMITCPHDLPVNDPAPILWKHMTSVGTTPALLGVPQALATEAKFKGPVPAAGVGKEKER